MEEEDAVVGRTAQAVVAGRRVLQVAGHRVLQAAGHTALAVGAAHTALGVVAGRRELQVAAHTGPVGVGLGPVGSCNEVVVAAADMVAVLVVVVVVTLGNSRPVPVAAGVADLDNPAAEGPSLGVVVDRSMAVANPYSLTRALVELRIDTVVERSVLPISYKRSG